MTNRYQYYIQQICNSSTGIKKISHLSDTLTKTHTGCECDVFPTQPQISAQEEIYGNNYIKDTQKKTQFFGQNSLRLHITFHLTHLIGGFVLKGAY